MELTTPTTFSDCSTPAGKKWHIVRLDAAGRADGVLCNYGNNAPGRRPIVWNRTPDPTGREYCRPCLDAYMARREPVTERQAPCETTKEEPMPPTDRHTMHPTSDGYEATWDGGHQSWPMTNPPVILSNDHTAGYALTKPGERSEPPEVPADTATDVILTNHRVAWLLVPEGPNNGYHGELGRWWISRKRAAVTNPAHVGRWVRVIDGATADTDYTPEVEVYGFEGNLTVFAAKLDAATPAPVRLALIASAVKWAHGRA